MKRITSHFAFVVLGVAALLFSGCDASSGSGESDMDSFADQMDQTKHAAEYAAEQQLKAAAEAKAKAEAQAEEEERKRMAAAKLAAEPPASEEDDSASITITVKNPEKLMKGVVAGAQQVRKDRMGEGTVGKRTRRNSVENGPLQYYGAISNARIVFEDRALGWQIQKSMDVYVNTHDGKYPKDTDEYMREIIEANSIVLPELPENQEYFYDPEDHELKIGEILDESSGDAGAPATEATAEPIQQ